MSSLKECLKLARQAINKKDYSEAASQCETAITWYNGSSDYMTLVLLAVATQNLESTVDRAVALYEKAIALNDSNVLAHQGLKQLYEQSKNWDKLESVLQKLAELYSEANDGKKLFETLNALVDNHLRKRSRPAAISTLLLFLPSSASYHLLSTSPDVVLPSPLSTYIRIAELQEAEDNEYRTREVEARRRRLGADPLEVIKRKVEEEIASQSRLGEFYMTILDIWSETTLSERHESGHEKDVQAIESKFLEVLERDTMYSPKNISNSQKQKLRDRLDESAKKMVEQRVHSSKCYEVFLESLDIVIGAYDLDLCEFLAASFPGHWLSVFGTAYKAYTEQRYDDVESNINDFMEANRLKTTSHVLLRLQCYAIHLSSLRSTETKSEEEIKAQLSLLENSKLALDEYCDRSGRSLPILTASLQVLFGRVYLSLGSKFLPNAVSAFKSALEAQRDCVEGFYGLGLSLLALSKPDEASKCFQKVLSLSDSNGSLQKHIDLDYELLSRGELGWISILKNDYEHGVETLKKVLETSEGVEMTKFSKLDRAKCVYRIGRGYWEMGGEFQAEKQNAYTYFVKAAQLDISSPWPFAYLGHYYLLPASYDRARAKKCFQKSYELGPAETDAAKHLARMCMEDDETDVASGVLQGVVAANPRVAWAWKSLGNAAMVVKNYNDAASAYQSALRCESKDASTWEGLAEAYFRSGKFMAALKAFQRATDLDPGRVSSLYFIGMVRMRLGMYTEAMQSFEELLKRPEGALHKPTLLSLVECRYLIARECFSGGLYGQSMLHLKDSVDIARQLVIDAGFDMQIIWKQVGDICQMVFRLLPFTSMLFDKDQDDIFALLDYLKHPARDNDSGAMVKLFSDMSFKIDKDRIQSIFELGVESYKRAIVMAKGTASDILSGYWHDLSLLLYRRYCSISTNATEYRTTLLQAAIRSIRIASNLDPQSQSNWQALGVYARESGNVAVSQHAFIRGIELDTKDACAWSNLGFLYLMYGDCELAAQAFQMSETADPEWPLGWAGHAFVQLLTGQDNALNMFSHAFDISYKSSSLEVNYHFASAIFKQHRNHLDGSVDLSTGTFALYKYTELRPTDEIAWNLLGLLLEHERRYTDAHRAFIRALELSLKKTNSVQSAKIAANLGRSLWSAGHYEESVKHYATAISALQSEFGNETSFLYHIIGAGLAYFGLGQLEESLKLFESALALANSHSSTGGQTESAISNKSDVMVLLSQVLYALGTDTHTKLAQDQLLQCVAHDPQHIPALLNLLAIGLLRGDPTLASSVAQELLKLSASSWKENDLDISNLIRVFFQINGDMKSARTALMKAVYRKPQDPTRWNELAKFLARYTPTHGSAAVFASEAACRLAASDVKHTQCADILTTKAMSLLAASRSKKARKMEDALKVSLRSTLKAMHMHPSCDDRHRILAGILVASLAALRLPDQTGAADMVAGTHDEVQVAKWRETEHMLRSTSRVLEGLHVKRAKILAVEQTQRNLETYLWTGLALAELHLLRAHLAALHKYDGEILSTISHAQQLAVGVIDQALAVPDGSQKRMQAYGYDILAHCQRLSGKLDEAIDTLKKAAALNPTDMGAWEELARLYDDIGLDAASELSLRTALGASTGTTHHARLLLRLARHAFRYEGKESLSFEAIGEILKSSSSTAYDQSVAKLLQGLLFLRQGGGNATRAGKILSTLWEDGKGIRFSGWAYAQWLKEKGDAEQAREIELNERTNWMPKPEETRREFEAELEFPEEPLSMIHTK